MDHKPILTSMKKGSFDREVEASSLPVLREMANDALKAFGSYERQKNGLAIATQCAVGTVNGKPAVSVVVVAVYPPEKVRAAIADALDQTLTFLTT